jgi:hypothetical protein
MCQAHSSTHLYQTPTAVHCNTLTLLHANVLSLTLLLLLLLLLPGDPP